jgi:hypothetical protein
VGTVLISRKARSIHRLANRLRYGVTNLLAEFGWAKTANQAVTFILTPCPRSGKHQHFLLEIKKTFSAA